jgi:N-formylglutamate deformylase
MISWLSVSRGEAPLIVAIPHAGTDIPGDVAAQLADLDLARSDADRFVDRLYAFAADLGATVIRTAISRSVIDVNRDPGGASLYPGMATTELCPTTAFDGTPLYVEGEPDEAEIARRRDTWFEPYHAAIRDEISRLRPAHQQVVLYDAHSIRSRVPRFFDGELPVFNIGTNGGVTCDPVLTQAVERICRATGEPTVVNGRFKGGWTTRHYGGPDGGVHAIQMELAMRCYLDEATGEWQPERAAATQAVLIRVLHSCIDFARGAA